MGLRSSVSCYNHCCFCCIPLRTGVIILAIIACVAGGWQSINGIQALANLTGAEIYVRVIINIAYVVSAVLLLVAAIKENYQLVLPYLVIVAIYIIVAVILAIIGLAGIGVVADKAINNENTRHWSDEQRSDANTGVAVGVSIVAGVLLAIGLINVHFWLVVYAYYEELKEGPVEDKDGRIPGRVMA